MLIFLDVDEVDFVVDVDFIVPEIDFAFTKIEQNLQMTDSKAQRERDIKSKDTKADNQRQRKKDIEKVR